MNQFTLQSTLKTFFIALMAIGVLSLGITWFTDDELHTRFWSNVLHNSVFFTGIALMAAFFMAASILVYAGWYVAFKRIFEAVASFLLPGFVIMLLLGIANYLHAHHLYHWTDATAVSTDPILAGKASFLNSNFYFFATLICGAAYIYLVTKIRTLSIDEDSETQSNNFATHRKMRFYAAILLPIIGFTAVVLIWQWIMSVDAHWYSTMFAWYSMASLFVSLMCLVALALLYLTNNGYYQNLNKHHIHDVGKFIFAFSVFWTYLWFSQFMLIWYANIGEETIYFRERYDHYPVLFFGNLIINFVLPFLVLLRNDTKWKRGSLSFIAIVVFLGHWLDFFLMIKPGTHLTAQEHLAHSAHGAEAAGPDGGHGTAEAAGHAVEHVSTFVSGVTMPGLLELGTMLGFLGFFGYFVFTTLSKSKLTPKNDPYIEESLHHHV